MWAACPNHCAAGVAHITSSITLLSSLQNGLIDMLFIDVLRLYLTGTNCLFWRSFTFVLIFGTMSVRRYAVIEKNEDDELD